MKEQTNFTSNVAKLINNPKKIAEIKKGIFRPSSMHFAITDICNLNCSFCSNKKREGNEFSFEEIKNILNTFRILGAKGVELTGGEPTIHPNINEIINYAKSINYSIGIKSNGVEIKDHLTEEAFKKLTWLRISLNCLDYIPVNKLDFLDIANYTVFGFSYVYHDFTNEQFIFEILPKLKEKYNAEYIRIIPDNSYSDEKIDFLNKTVGKDKIFKIPGIFWHNKNYSLPETCWWMYIKPFINTDKNIYYCCATQMFERKFIPKYRLCSTNSNDIIETWMNPHPIPGKICKGGKCYYKEHNDFIKVIVDGCIHPEFM